MIHRPIMFCTIVSVAFTSTSTTTTTFTTGENTSSATSTTISTSTTVPSISESSSTYVEFYSTTASSKTLIDSATELESSTAAHEDIFTSESYSVPPTNSAAPKDTPTITEYYSGDDSTTVDLISTPFGLMSSGSELVSEKQMAMTTEPQRSTQMAFVSTTSKASVDKTTAIPVGGSGDVDGSGDIDGSGDVDNFFSTLPVEDTTTQDTTTQEVVTETVEVDVTTEDELDLERDGLFTFGRSTVTAVTRDITTEILVTTKGGGSYIK